MNFAFATASRILFGAGLAQQLGRHAASLGQRPFVVTGSNPDRHAELLQSLTGEGLTYTIFPVSGEPDVELMERGVATLQAADCDCVVAIGGGSAIDSGKAISALAANPGAPLDYLEVVGAGKPLQHDPLPFVAVPTTAGTGAEVTRNAVLSVPEKRVKVSLRDARMLPTIAILDPELTRNLPPEITATTGMDALTQVIEPFVSPFANPITDGLCREGVTRAATALRRVYHHPQGIEAREQMMLVSLMGGLALANAKLGAVHGFAGALGGVTGAAHGAICGSLLPHVTAANLRAISDIEPDHPALARYQEVATILTGKADAQPADAVDWLQALAAELSIPPLGTLGLRAEDIEKVAHQSMQSSSMKGNPVQFAQDELAAILMQAL